MSLFTQDKLTPYQSSLVLNSVSGFLAEGLSLLKSLNFVGETFGGTIEVILTNLHEEVKFNSTPMVEALELYGVLTPEESTLFGNKEGNALKAIKSIIDLRKYGNKYESILSKSLRGTIIIAIATLAILYYYADMIIEQLKHLKQSTISTANETIDISFIPYYLINKEILLYAIGAILFVVILFVIIYKHLYNNNRPLLYKIFKSKAYDDIPRLFHIMVGMKSSGSKTTIGIFEHLKDAKEYRGLSAMFEELEEAVRIKANYSPIFQENNFPKDVSILIRAKEETSFWEGIESLINYTRNRADEEFDRIQGAWNTINLFLPYVIPTYFIIDLGMILESATKISY